MKALRGIRRVAQRASFHACRPTARNRLLFEREVRVVTSIILYQSCDSDYTFHVYVYMYISHICALFSVLLFLQFLGGDDWHGRAATRDTTSRRRARGAHS